MIRAYKEIYLSKAQRALGDAFDYAINACNITGNDIINMFIVSSFSKRIEKGDPSCIAGRSGIELALDVIFEVTGKRIETRPTGSSFRSKEYWIGWAIAYYQWYSDRKFSDIFYALPFDDLENMYYTLHEADISKFVDVANKKMKEAFPDTNLKRLV